MLRFFIYGITDLAMFIHYPTLRFTTINRILKRIDADALYLDSTYEHVASKNEARGLLKKGIPVYYVKHTDYTTTYFVLKPLKTKLFK